MGGSWPLLGVIIQQATLFSVAFGVDYLVSTLFEGQISLFLVLVPIFEIAVYKIVTRSSEDRVLFVVQLTFALPLGLLIAALSGGYVQLD